MAEFAISALAAVLVILVIRPIIIAVQEHREAHRETLRLTQKLTDLLERQNKKKEE